MDQFKKYSIGIVTYHARFEKYFIPLIEKLSSVFPDIEILCIINGHPDRTLQINYLNSVTAFLSKFPNTRYLTYDTNQSLAKCWNQLVILSQTEKTIIMNDDTQVTDLFRKEFETKALKNNFSTFNTSWSHFLISKEIIKKIGWFDERLLGVGYEDADYVFRLAMMKLPLTNIICLGLNNYVVDQENPGWKDISPRMGDTKYASVNLDFFRQKWSTSDLDPQIKLDKFKYKIDWNNSPYFFSPKTDESTPLFYDLKCLDHKNITNINYSLYIGNRLKLTSQKIYFVFVRLIKKILKKILF